MGKTKKEATSSSSTAFTLQRLQSFLSSQPSIIEFTSHSVRIGSLVWDTQTFLRNIKHNLTYAFTLLLLLEKTQALGAPQPPTLKIDFYTSDPTGTTNYEFGSYSDEDEMTDVPNDIINNCHPNMTSLITAAVYSTLATVGDITAFIARGGNQPAQAEFERCMIEQMQNAYDEAEEAANLTIAIILSSVFGGPIIVCLLMCLGVACYVAYRLSPLNHYQNNSSQPSLAEHDTLNEIELGTIAATADPEKSASIEEKEENPDLETNATEAEKEREEGSEEEIYRSGKRI